MTKQPQPQNAHLQINANDAQGVIARIWANIGYDELNWTYTTRGKTLLRTLNNDVFTQGDYTVRMHNTFTTGNGLSSPAWGAGNVYHTRVDGSAYYDWQVLDQAFDTIVKNGGVPLVELGFTPFDLTPPDLRATGFKTVSDQGLNQYEFELWKKPPADEVRWGELVKALVQHVVDRYGATEVKKWMFELWNEPDIPNYWQGTVEEYNRLYDVSAVAVKSVLPEAAMGGPATTGFICGAQWLEQFLAHLNTQGTRPDFISFHTKGAFFAPRRIYNPEQTAPHESHSTAYMLGEIERSLKVIEQFPAFRNVPIYLDECDPAVGTIYGVYDNPNFIITNSEHYPTFVCQLVAKLLDYPQIKRITHWAFYMEGKRWFEGNRTLVDNENVEKPILNGLRMLEKLAGTQRLQTQSDNEKVGVLAGKTGETIYLLVWHHDDDWRADGLAHITISLEINAPNSDATIWRIDKNHANTYRTWEALGAPQDPSPEQIAVIRQGGQLQAEPIPLVRNQTQTQLHLAMPMHSLALIEIKPIYSLAQD